MQISVFTFLPIDGDLLPQIYIINELLFPLGGGVGSHLSVSSK